MNSVASQPQFDATVLLNSLSAGLVVSCQPVDGGPLDRDEIVVAFAQAAEASGAAAVRIEGAKRVAAVRQAIAIPIIGIVKRDFAEWPVRITPLVEDVRHLASAGANIIAVDATNRARPVPIAALVSVIHAAGAASMADCSNLHEALAARDLGFAIVGSTLSGYVDPTWPTPEEPDFQLVQSMAAAGLRVMAEGRFNSPQQAARAIAMGAWAVTVGSAITRPEVVTGWFRDAIAGAAEAAPGARAAAGVSKPRELV
jgi:putative N-acetylmannosamine-6-phosphate epimerase